VPSIGSCASTDRRRATNCRARLLRQPVNGRSGVEYFVCSEDARCTRWKPDATAVHLNMLACSALPVPELVSFGGHFEIVGLFCLLRGQTVIKYCSARFTEVLEMENVDILAMEALAPPGLHHAGACMRVAPPRRCVHACCPNDAPSLTASAALQIWQQLSRGRRAR